MRSNDRSSAISRLNRRRRGRPEQRPPVQSRASWTCGTSALGVVAIVCGFGFVTSVAAEPAAAARFTPEEQGILEELPFGFSGNSCDTASNPPPGAVASLECGQDAGLDSPLGGRFTRFADLDSMNSALQNDLTNRGPDYVASACPGLDALPATWHYDATPWEAAGQVFCGTFKGAPDMEWTRDRQLLLLNVHDGPGVDRLYQWWEQHGNEPREPIPFTR